MWDPKTYLEFADHRSRPFFELVGRIDAEQPRAVVDLGCGPGNLTATLLDRWPSARVSGMDSAPEMVDAALQRGVRATVGDVADWTPGEDVDVVVCNAVLQWVPGHEKLLCSWVDALASGAWLAFQVPGNFDAQSHVLVRELASGPRWRGELAGVALRGEDAVRTPQEYADLLAGQGCVVDAWETTYLQRLAGRDPVLGWITGTALRPVRAALDDARWAEFTAELAPLLRAAYPAAADGHTWFPFRRIFVVTRKP